MRSVQLSLGTGPSSWCGSQVEEADSNLQLRPSEVGDEERFTQETHTHISEHENTQKPVVWATWPRAGTGRFAGHLNLIQSGLWPFIGRTVWGQLKLDWKGNIGSVTVGKQTDTTSFWGWGHVRSHCTSAAWLTNLSHQNLLSQILKDSPAKVESQVLVTVKSWRNNAVPRPQVRGWHSVALNPCHVRKLEHAKSSASAFFWWIRRGNSTWEVLQWTQATPTSSILTSLRKKCF